MKQFFVIVLAIQGGANAQEASSGLDLGGTVSGVAAYSRQLLGENGNASPAAGAFRATVYPTWKINENWNVSGALQVHSTPYFTEEYGTHRYDVKLNLLRLAVTYTRVRPGRSLVIRAGQLSSAFGSFLSRYDDGVNPLIDVPLAYGYYERGVTYLGLAGISVEAAAGKLDARAQFVNSSPANRRSLFDREQYGNWAGGLGYTITQGFRIGISAYRGPYLDRHHEHYSPGEADPHQLPGSAYGIEAQWVRGHWSAYGELQKFLFTYRAIQDYNTHLGYAELRRVLRPRWYLAGRASYRRASAGPALEIYEAVVGFRLSRHQLIKTGYEIQQRAGTNGDTAGVFAVQLVTTLPSISVAGR